MKSQVFIGSSVEQLDLAYATQEALEHDVESTVWTQDVFTLSKNSLASLIDQLGKSDFGIFVLAPDDITVLRDEDKRTVRDNVVFELGLFIGRLGVDRCFLIVPRNVHDLHLPSDLAGITPANYEPNRQDGNVVAALGPACSRIRKAMTKIGPMKETASEVGIGNDQGDLCSDPIDCQALIQTWMGGRGRAENQSAIRYSVVDTELRLAAGSAKNYIKKAARHWGYEPLLEGKDTITFKQIDSY